MRSRILLVVLALLGVGCAVAQNLDSAPSDAPPLFQVDVTKLGYARINADRPTRTFIDFTDNEHIVVGWLTVDNPSRAKKFGPVFRRPAHLHALIFNATTGNKENGKEWPTLNLDSALVARPDGTLLTCTGKALRLFSSNLELVREQELAGENGCGTLSLVGQSVSPSRRTILISFPGTMNDQAELLHSETFAILSKWTEKRVTRGISDHWVVGDCASPLKLCVRKLDEQWQAFSPDGLDQQLAGQRQRYIFFVNDETLVIVGGGGLGVTTVQSRLLFQRRLPEKHEFEWPVTSAGGKRFAVIEDKMRGLRSDPLDIGQFPSNDRAVVFDIADGRAVYAVKLMGTSPWSWWNWHKNRLALSPNGNILAVLADGMLKVYRLPSTPAGQP
jgi:hypothetical protein